LFNAIEALESLPSGDYLRFRHRMKPCHLYAVLERSGLAWDTRHGKVVECEVFIWHKGDEAAAADAAREAEQLTPWDDE
jgi:hypothetical protein